VTQGPVSPDPGQDDNPARGAGEPGRTPDDGPQGHAGGIPDGREPFLSGPDWLADEELLDWLSTVAPGDENPENDPGQAARGAKASRAPKGSLKGSRVPEGSVPQGSRLEGPPRSEGDCPCPEGEAPRPGAARFRAAAPW
jgi:hypothetical protein